MSVPASHAYSEITRRTVLLRQTAQSFCAAFIRGDSPRELLDTYFTARPAIHEHGPSWARERLPFLAYRFEGRGSSSRGDDDRGGNRPLTCDDYYALLGQTLAFHPAEDMLPGDDGFAVDAGVAGGVVSVRMKARFSSVRTGKGWEEEFVYVMGGWEIEGEKARIGTLDLWADPLSAWVAVGGEG
ncbi:MAG: hypothetical protein LQ342_002576 [Letrouitia transgressa]|nr:MAG: hypothetical protein LQ342_002576 [Letrouitia transgressa]